MASENRDSIVEMAFDVASIVIALAAFLVGLMQLGEMRKVRQVYESA
jgi:hypothetical protein